MLLIAVASRSRKLSLHRIIAEPISLVFLHASAFDMGRVFAVEKCVS